MRSKLIVCLAFCWLGCNRPDPLRVDEDLRMARSTVLIEALRDPSTDRRARAALAMGRIQATEYAEYLVEAAADTDREVRLAALFALGQLGLSQGVEPPQVAVRGCVVHLGDADAAIVAAAAEALGKLAPAGASDALVPLLRHTDVGVRREAVSALFRLRFVPVWRGETEEPPQLDPATLQALLAALSDEDVQVRRAAAHACSRFGQAGAEAALFLAAADEDEWVRMFAIRAVGRTEGEAGLDRLAAATADSSARVRAEAILALAAKSALDRVPTAAKADPDYHVRVAVARAAAQSNDPRSREMLETLRQDPSTAVRVAAIESLARRLGSVFKLKVVRLSTDEDWRLRAAAAGALRHLDPPPPELVDRLIDDPDHRVRLAVLQALGSMDAFADRLLSALGSNELSVRGTAVELLAAGKRPDRRSRLEQAYGASTGEAWIEVRESIVRALAEAEPTIGFLREVAGTDPAPSVRSAARSALRRHGEPVDEPQASLPAVPSRLLQVRFDTDPVVILETTRGTLEIRCHAAEAPVHVAGFVELVRKGYYDGLVWHRVVTNFVIQGGDPLGDGWGGSGTLLRDEINRLPFVRGAVGMPKAGKDTGAGQLFITHVPTPHLDGNYTVFGQVVNGLDVIDRIEVGDAIVRARVRELTDAEKNRN